MSHFPALLDTIHQLKTEIAELKAQVQATREQVALLSELACGNAPEPIVSDPESVPVFLRRQAS